MPRNQKESQGRELEDQEHELGDAPLINENPDEREEADRAEAGLGTKPSREDEEADALDVDEDDIAEEIDLDDLSAMEGPDA